MLLHNSVKFQRCAFILTRFPALIFLVFFTGCHDDCSVVSQERPGGGGGLEK